MIYTRNSLSELSHRRTATESISEYRVIFVIKYRCIGTFFELLQKLTAMICLYTRRPVGSVPACGAVFYTSDRE